MIIVFLISLIACSMNPETAVTFTCGHFNKVVFSVNLICLGTYNLAVEYLFHLKSVARLEFLALCT